MTPHTWSCNRNFRILALSVQSLICKYDILNNNGWLCKLTKKKVDLDPVIAFRPVCHQAFIFGSWLLLQRDICSATCSIFDSQCGIKELKLSSQTLLSFTPFFGENWHRLLLSPQSSLSTNILGTKLPWHWVNPCSFKLCSQGKKTDLEFS